MLWLQTLPSFAIWVAYAYFRRGWMRSSRERFAPIPRGTRIALMFGALGGSLAALFGGIWGTASLGWLDGNMTVLSFMAVTAVGLLFVHLQMIATALTLSLALETETRPPGLTSNTRSIPSPTPGDTE